MRILISTNYKGSWPYIPEMVDAFNKRGFVCDIYDTGECRLIYNNLKSEKYLINKNIFAILLKLPKIRSYVKKYLNKIFYEKFKMKYDILTIHYIEISYFDIIKTIKVFAKKSVGVAWGSDIYRIKDHNHIKMCRIINNMDYLIATKPMIEYLEKKPKAKIDIKTKQIFVVSKSIDNLSKLIDEETKEYSKKQLGIPKDTFVVSFGYNAGTFQQHELFIKNLKTIRKALPNNILLLLQMTYGENKKNYIDDIDDQLKNLDLNYKIFREFLNDKDVLRIRRVSDITINIQTTDALSSSIREHLFANNVVIVGDWLPYEIFAEMGIYYLKTNINNLEATIIDCLKNYDDHKLKAQINRELIYKQFSFESNIDEWIDFYKEILNKE